MVNQTRWSYGNNPDITLNRAVLQIDSNYYGQARSPSGRTSGSVYVESGLTNVVVLDYTVLATLVANRCYLQHAVISDITASSTSVRAIRTTLSIVVISPFYGVFLFVIALIWLFQKQF